MTDREKDLYMAGWKAAFKTLRGVLDNSMYEIDLVARYNGMLVEDDEPQQMKLELVGGKSNRSH